MLERPEHGKAPFTAKCPLLETGVCVLSGDKMQMVTTFAGPTLEKIDTTS